MPTIKNVLIVEDESLLADTLKTALFREGLTATVEPNGKKALHRLGIEKFDLVLLDLVMPHMDGFETLQHLKGVKDTPPIVVLTNLSQPDDIHRAEKLGARKVLVKAEVNLEKIVTEIKSILA